MGNLIFIIIMIILFYRASKKKNKMPGENRAEKEPISEPFEVEQRRKPSKSQSTPRRINMPRRTAMSESKPEPKPVVEKQTKISQRVEQQHSEYDRSRIHQEVHKSEEPPAPPEIMMEKVKELIVCGYPTQIPGQRDFVKEGEDFLAGLGANNTFF